MDAMAIPAHVSDLSSMTNYTNVHFFCACIFLLSSLSNAKDPLILLRYQLAVVYLGSWTNKIFDADWRSGQYFEHWMSDIIKREAYVKATSWLPPLVLSKIMCWSTILTEMFLSAGFILRPLKHLTILTGVYFHSIAFLLAWYDFRVFTIAILSSYLILVRWPETMIVRYNERIAPHQVGKKIFEFLDWERRIEWQAGYDGWTLSALERTFEGLLALKRLVLYTPFFYFAYVAVLGLPNEPFLWLKLKAVQLTLILFFPWPEMLEYLKTKNRKAVRAIHHQ